MPHPTTSSSSTASSGSSRITPPTFTHGPGPRFQVAFAGWSKEFVVPVSFQEGIVRAARAAHRFTGQIQDLVESQAAFASDASATPAPSAFSAKVAQTPSSKSELRDQVARMQDEGGDVAGSTSPLLKRAQ